MTEHNNYDHDHNHNHIIPENELTLNISDINIDNLDDVNNINNEQTLKQMLNELETKISGNTKIDDGVFDDITKRINNKLKSITNDEILSAINLEDKVDTSWLNE